MFCTKTRRTPFCWTFDRIRATFFFHSSKCLKHLFSPSLQQKNDHTHSFSSSYPTVVALRPAPVAQPALIRTRCSLSSFFSLFGFAFSILGSFIFPFVYKHIIFPSQKSSSPCTHITSHSTTSKKVPVVHHSGY